MTKWCTRELYNVSGQVVARYQSFDNIHWFRVELWDDLQEKLDAGTTMVEKMKSDKAYEIPKGSPYDAGAHGLPKLMRGSRR